MVIVDCPRSGGGCLRMPCMEACKVASYSLKAHASIPYQTSCSAAGFQLKLHFHSITSSNKGWWTLAFVLVWKRDHHCTTLSSTGALTTSLATPAAATRASQSFLHSPLRLSHQPLWRARQAQHLPSSPQNLPNPPPICLPRRMSPKMRMERNNMVCCPRQSLPAQS